MPTTFTSNKLKPNTTYYICLSAEGEQPIDYSIIAKDPDSESTAYKTAGNFTEARGPVQTNTTYYICLSAEGEQPIDYSIIAKDPDSESTAYKTAGNFTEARGPVQTENGILVPGTNQNNAAMLPMGTKVSGSHNPDMYDWFSFTTGEVQGTTTGFLLQQEKFRELPII